MTTYKDYGWQNAEFTNAHSYLLPAIKKMLTGKKEELILDIGCGNGAIASFLIKEGYNVYGTDASKKGIQLANKSNPGRFFLQDLSIDGLPDELKNLSFKL